MDKIIKNKDYIIEIQGLGYEGEGVGKLDGFPIFVEGALPEEKALVKIVKVNKRYGFGKLMEVIKPSQNRVEPKCSIYKKCGGCQLQHLSYSEQLVYKKQRVKECLERIGQIKDVTIHDTLGMKTPYKYRNKVQLPVGKKDNEIRIGFYAQRSHDIINMDSCLIQDEAADKVVAITKAWMLKHNIQGYDETTPAIDDKTRIRHLMVRKGFKSGEIMVVLVTDKDKISFINEFVEDIKANIEGVASIIQNINPEATNVILGKKNITLWGNDCIVDYIDKYKFSISPLSFFQVNPIQTEVLYKKALEYAEITGEETVFDAYCGTGTISLFLAEKAKKVYGVEIIPEAIENAKNNAVQNNISNVEFLVGEAEKVIPELINQGVYADVVVVDPPRKGCEKSLLEAISLMKPKRIVYVSCDAGTLARDLAILQELGYLTKEVQPVDMFPMTAHVECVAMMYLKEKC